MPWHLRESAWSVKAAGQEQSLEHFSQPSSDFLSYFKAFFKCKIYNMKFTFLTFSFKKKNLAALGLSCNMWDLVPWPGIEPRALHWEHKSLSHWTTREVPPSYYWMDFKESSGMFCLANPRDSRPQVNFFRASVLVESSLSQVGEVKVIAMMSC